VVTYNEEEEEGRDHDEEEEEPPHRKIKFCKACAQIVTVGQRCPQMPCHVRLHNHCVGKMFRAQRDSETCPTCKTEWHDAPAVGIKAAAVKEAARSVAAGRRSTNGTAANGRRRGAAAVVNGHDEEDGGEESGMEVDDGLS
jgi:hypothetical protein